MTILKKNNTQTFNPGFGAFHEMREHRTRAFFVATYPKDRR